MSSTANNCCVTDVAAGRAIRTGCGCRRAGQESARTGAPDSNRSGPLSLIDTNSPSQKERRKTLAFSWDSAALVSSTTEPIYGDDDPERFEGWRTEIPQCQGAWGFGETPDQSQQMLWEALEDRVVIAVDAGHSVPVSCGLRVGAPHRRIRQPRQPVSCTNAGRVKSTVAEVPLTSGQASSLFRFQ